MGHRSLVVQDYLYYLGRCVCFPLCFCSRNFGIYGKKRDGVTKFAHHTYFFMKLYYFLFISFLASCSQNSDSSKDKKSDTTIISYDTIPPVRKTVSSKPVATYSMPIDDPAYHWSFAISIYETPKTFRYLMKLQYKAMFATDTLKIPNFGISPIIQIKPGKDSLSCIVGFLDKKKEFKEYKLISAKGDKLKVTILKSYYVGGYMTAY